MPLGRKQSINNDEWLKAIQNIEKTVSKKDLDLLVNKTIKEIKAKTKGKKAAYAWSAGKDSIVLGDICKKAGITECFIGVCDLEYPAFMQWIKENKPQNCTMINTGQNLEWLSKHQDMLFPIDSSKAAQWFSIVQHRAQKKYFKDNELSIILLGRRKADGNFVGRGNNIYTDRNGVTRYSPLSEWKHEDILAYLHYYNMPLPPIYDWKNGYLCGTHPWPARQWTGTIENGWQEVYDIDKSIVINAADKIESAKRFLEVAKCK